MSRLKRRRTMAEKQWLVVGALVREAQRLGMWPSSREVAKALGMAARTVRFALECMQDEGLAVSVGHGLGAGWMPTSEALAWRGLSMPTLERGSAAPRSVRCAGVGAVRMWNRRQRLRERLAAAEVFDRDAVSDGDAFEG